MLRCDVSGDLTIEEQPGHRRTAQRTAGRTHNPEHDSLTFVSGFSFLSRFWVVAVLEVPDSPTRTIGRLIFTIFSRSQVVRVVSTVGTEGRTVEGSIYQNHLEPQAISQRGSPTDPFSTERSPPPHHSSPGRVLGVSTENATNF